MLISMKISDSDTSRMLFFLHINVKMPTIVDILTFMCRKNIILDVPESEIFILMSMNSAELSTNKKYNLGANLSINTVS